MGSKSGEKKAGALPASASLYVLAAAKATGSLPPRLFGLVFLLQQHGQHFVAEVTLNQDVTVLGIAAHPALGFEQLAQALQISVAAHEAGNKRDHLAPARLFVELHAQ